MDPPGCHKARRGRIVEIGIADDLFVQEDAVDMCPPAVVEKLRAQLLKCGNGQGGSAT